MKILLKEIRKGKKLTLLQLEELSGVSKSALSRIEREDVGLGLLEAEMIAKGLNIKITDLFESSYK